MKTNEICKIALVLLSFLTFNNAVYSQFTPVNTDELVTEKRVGIGYESSGIPINNSNALLSIRKNSNSIDNLYLGVEGNYSPNIYLKKAETYTNIVQKSVGLTFEIQGDPLMILEPYNGGKVKIGDVTAGWNGNYKLFVEKGILTEKVKVAIKGSSNWSDYVFEEDYKLNSLNKVEKYVKKNKHLPNVPSADEIVENGINLGEMDATLLRQIEELWLHTIELNREKENLEDTVEKLVKRVAKLENK